MKQTIALFLEMRRTLNSTKFSVGTFDHRPPYPDHTADPAFQYWKSLVCSRYPQVEQLHLLQKHDLWNSIKICSDRLNKYRRIEPQLGCWLWALLAKSKPYESMSHTEVGLIRDLGKRAVEIRYGRKGNRQNPKQRKNDKCESNSAARTYTIDVTAESPDDGDHEGISEGEDQSDPRNEPFEKPHRGLDEMQEEKMQLMENSPGERKLNDTAFDVASTTHDFVNPPSNEAFHSNNSNPNAASISRDEGRRNADSIRVNRESKQSLKPAAEEVHDLDSKATLEMIIIVVGELYGQRDLLDSLENSE
jgi:hypothetical protein